MGNQHGGCSGSAEGISVIPFPILRHRHDGLFWKYSETGVKTVFRNKKSTSSESWSDIPPVGEADLFYPVYQPPVPGAVKNLYHSYKNLIMVW